MKVKIFVFIVTLFFCSLSNAGPNDWINFGRITSVIEDASGLYLYTDKVGTGTAGIEACGGNRLFISTGDLGPVNTH